jgi:hypothetical protein
MNLCQNTNNKNILVKNNVQLDRKLFYNGMIFTGMAFN